MEKLLRIAESRGCRAEVYSVRNKSLGMGKINGAVNDVSASIQSGVSLRVIKNGMTGMSYTKNLIDREELVDNAMASLKAGVEADYDYPASGDVEYTAEYDETVESMDFPCLKGKMEELEELYSGVKSGIVGVNAGCGTTEITIMNSSGARLVHRESGVYRMGLMIYPGTSTGLRNVFQGKSDGVIHHPDVQRTKEFFESSLPEVEIGGGRMKVLLPPEAMYAFTWSWEPPLRGKPSTRRYLP